jgi:hypothetical protein
VIVTVFYVNARNATRTAVSQSHIAQSENMAAEATNLLPADGPLAMLLGLQAYETAPTPQAESALLQVTQQPLDDLLVSGSQVQCRVQPAGGPWRSATAAVMSACGTWRPGGGPAPSRKAAGSSASRSALTGVPWPPATASVMSACGTWRPGGGPPPSASATRRQASRSVPTGTPAAGDASYVGMGRGDRAAPGASIGHSRRNNRVQPDGRTPPSAPLIAMSVCGRGGRAATATLAGRIRPQCRVRS